MKTAIGKLFFTLLSVLLIVSTASAQIPPGALFWFKADAGVIEDGSGVSTWQDQSGNNNHAYRGSGPAPQLATVTFPSGDQPVVRFNADSWLLLTDSQALTPTDFTVFAVISVEPASRSTYFCNYSNAINWGYGFTLDTNPNRTLHLYSGAGSQACYSDWFTTATPDQGPYHIVTSVVNSTSQTKTFYSDGDLVQSTAFPCLTYHPTVVACIGSLIGQAFLMDGDIAELIMYPSADTALRSQVEQYLDEKYNVPAPPQLSCGEWDFHAADFNLDCQVNLDDFLLMTDVWLWCNDPFDSQCGSQADILTRLEQSDLDLWMAAHFSGNHPVPPFSFTYQGVSSQDFLGTWQFQRISEELDAQRTRWTLTYTDPQTGLVVRCEATEYHDYPAFEWVVHFVNGGNQDTPIMQNIQALDGYIRSDLGGDFALRYSSGCNQLITDFQPHDVVLEPDVTLRLGPSGGRSSSALLLPPETNRANSVGIMPYFNLSQPDESGLMMAVGWSGQWASSFKKISSTTLQVQAGMEITYLKLHPGEEIRTPAMLLLFWSGGDNLRGHNLFRRLLVDHYSPTPGGVPAQPPVAASPHGTIGFCDSTAATMIQGINNVADNLTPIDTWWIDAGWYECLSIPNVAPWNSVGTWQPDPVRYPNGMKPVADAAHARGLKFLLWFEVERAVQDTWIYDNHPDWLLQHGALPPDILYQDPFYLVNFGHPDALAWAKTTFSQMIQDVGIDIYRIDLNMDPLYYWRHGEPWDRRGINEIKHITGWYEYLDTLMQENPDLLIDNCAGGGRRLDFEMVRRSVSLTPSDYLWEPVGEQAMTYALSLWIPLHGIGSVSLNPYDFRSGMGTSFVSVFDFYNSPSSWSTATSLLNEYLPLQQLYWGDFYPLTPYSVNSADWMAWQYDRPDLDQGFVQAFRRSGSATGAMTFMLQGLESAANYTVNNVDFPGPKTRTGAELMMTGLTINIYTQPGSAIVKYQKQ